MVVPMASKQKIIINFSGSKQWFLLLCSVPHGRSPDGKAERNLVEEVSKVVDQVEHRVIDAAQQVSEEVAKRVDAPASSDDDAHGVEGILHRLRDLITRASHFSSLTRKDLEQDEGPSGHADHESSPWVDDAGLPM